MLDGTEEELEEELSSEQRRAMWQSRVERLMFNKKSAAAQLQVSSLAFCSNFAFARRPSELTLASHRIASSALNAAQIRQLITAADAAGAAAEKLRLREIEMGKLAEENLGLRRELEAAGAKEREIAHRAQKKDMLNFELAEQIKARGPGPVGQTRVGVPGRQRRAPCDESKRRAKGAP